MKWDEEDRHTLLATIEDFEEYLSSPQLNWVLPGYSTTLTLGSILLSLKRLSSRKSQTLPSDVQQAISKIEETKGKRTSIWERKIEAEFPYRIRLWENIISDYYEEGRLDQAYSAQVRNRVILDLLSKERRLFDLKQDNKITDLDLRLRKLTGIGSFVWDPVLEAVFDPEKFWYLYVRTG